MISIIHLLVVTSNPIAVSSYPPKLENLKFDGKIVNWKSFRNQYPSSIDSKKVQVKLTIFFMQDLCYVIPHEKQFQE